MNSLDAKEIAVRLAVAVALGSFLGFERERHGRAAGLRTTMLVCVASAVAMIISEDLYLMASGKGGWGPDPARLAAGILAGMGFLGAGVIIRQGNAIHGVTTAAVLWFSAILGMAAGMGHWLAAGGGFVVALIALYLLPKIEDHVESDRYFHLDIYTSPKGPAPERLKQTIQKVSKRLGMRPGGMERDLENKEVWVRFEVKVKQQWMEEIQVRVVNEVAKLPGVKRVHWK